MLPHLRFLIFGGNELGFLEKRFPLEYAIQSTMREKEVVRLKESWFDCESLLPARVIPRTRTPWQSLRRSRFQMERGGNQPIHLGIELESDWNAPRSLHLPIHSEIFPQSQ
ncbi:hypothetical protein NE237_018323 [Protea cynaroides]|uniref:Uncharacterized protein n=1 Tax=Protea cynaroides TaxID=273540 RepID=A0A9Q0K9R3_9MAGN|nr:hypothetical protein NE237_018323 [Protea cynaroides]